MTIYVTETFRFLGRMGIMRSFEGVQLVFQTRLTGARQRRPTLRPSGGRCSGSRMCCTGTGMSPTRSHTHRNVTNQSYNLGALMSRAPLLTDKVATSLEAILKVFAPGDYIGTEREPGVKYLAALVKHHRDPEIVTKRRKNVARTTAHRKGSKHGQAGD